MLSFLGLQKRRCQAVKPAFYLKGLLFQRLKAKSLSNGEVSQAPQTFRESHTHKNWLQSSSSCIIALLEITQLSYPRQRMVRATEVPEQCKYLGGHVIVSLNSALILKFRQFHSNCLGDLTERLLQDNLAYILRSVCMEVWVFSLWIAEAKPILIL